MKRYMKTVPLDFTDHTEAVDPFLNSIEIDAQREADNFLDRRRAERAPVGCQIGFISEERSNDNSRAVGTLCDLSKTGCKIFSLNPPSQGTQITLILHLPDEQPPMYLIGTNVRNVRGYEFGVEFIALTPKERRRLQAIIFKHVTWSPYSLRRPAFRIT